MYVRKDWQLRENSLILSCILKFKHGLFGVYAKNYVESMRIDFDCEILSFGISNIQ